jgi:hypothetical protein
MDAHYACAEFDFDSREYVPWTNGDGMYRGVFGNADQTGVDFTYDQTYTNWNCNAKFRLYCFEQ